jgi:D-alanine--poly(phosphoribitol) ligase subunit 2
MNEIISELKNYFSEIYKGEIKNNSNLFEQGILDSMGIMKLIAFIEEKFKITADAEEITEDNFSTINSIVKLISGKLK